MWLWEGVILRVVTCNILIINGLLVTLGFPGVLGKNSRGFWARSVLVSQVPVLSMRLTPQPTFDLANVTQPSRSGDLIRRQCSSKFGRGPFQRRSSTVSKTGTSSRRVARVGVQPHTAILRRQQWHDDTLEVIRPGDNQF
jgi:hypothetical protein